MFAFSADGDYYAVGHCEPEMVIETGNGSVTFVNDAADIPEPTPGTHPCNGRIIKYTAYKGERRRHGQTNGQTSFRAVRRRKYIARRIMVLILLAGVIVGLVFLTKALFAGKVTPNGGATPTPELSETPAEPTPTPKPTPTPELDAAADRDRAKCGRIEQDRLPFGNICEARSDDPHIRGKRTYTLAAAINTAI